MKTLFKEKVVDQTGKTIIKRNFYGRYFPMPGQTREALGQAREVISIEIRGDVVVIMVK